MAGREGEEDFTRGAVYVTRTSEGRLMNEQANAEHPWVGRRVGGRFLVTRVLGEGGMGVVYEGEQQMGSTVRRVAIKTLHPHLSQDASILARFHRECGTVAQLEHPNTIKVYDFGAEADGTLYIAMEFVDGRSLDRVIEQEGPLAPRRVVEILRQVCGALDEAHNQGIVHRDLKPENIILGERLGRADFVKVLDFGIAARQQSADAQKEQKLTQQGMVLGTPPYMSPEQFTGEELDRRSDIYSLGVMTYEMLTGQLPFQANTPWQWATEHMTAQPKPLETQPAGERVPRAVREAVMGALAKKPASRPATAGAFLEQLEAGLASAAGGAGVVAHARTEAMQVPAALVQSGATGVSGLSESGSAREARLGASAATSHALSATQDIEIPVKKSNTGALFALLGSVAAVGLAAFFIFRGASSPEEPPGADLSGASPAASTGEAASPVSPEPAPSAQPSSETQPQPENPDVSKEGAAPKPSASATATATSTPKQNTTPPPTATSTSKPKTPTPTPTATSTATATATSQPPPTPVDCGTCLSAVSAGNWSSASSIFAKCDANGQTQCRAHARREAVTQAQAASGNCSRLKAIQSGAIALGANSKRVDDAVKACQ